MSENEQRHLASDETPGDNFAEQLSELQDRVDKLEAQLLEFSDLLSEDDDLDDDPNDTDTERKSNSSIRTLGFGIFFAPFIYRGTAFLIRLLTSWDMGWDTSATCFAAGLILILMVPTDSPFKRFCRWLDTK